MSVRVRLPALFADRIEGISTVEVRATTVADALRALTDRHAELTTLVWRGDGALNPLMVLFLNDRQLARPGLDETVHPGDQLEIIPAIEGG
ncbi:MAG: MoaD/ThiS family protein [Acidobacteria bacterium]|nr:MoaD/ThiS family protein [Acidobacteriota bacterium]